jgi:hypothetical protein
MLGGGVLVGVCEALLGSGPGRKTAAQRSNSRQSKYVFASRYLCASRASSRASTGSRGSSTAGGSAWWPLPAAVSACACACSSSRSCSCSAAVGSAVSSSAALCQHQHPQQEQRRPRRSSRTRTISPSGTDSARCTPARRPAAAPGAGPRRRGTGRSWRPSSRGAGLCWAGCEARRGEARGGEVGCRGVRCGATTTTHPGARHASYAREYDVPM